MNVTKLFIDGSYFVFYRYYAISNWYKLQKGDDFDSNKLMEDAMFIDKYNQMFEKTIIGLTKKYHIHYENIYFFKDCPRENIWRNAHITDYKDGRIANNFNRDIFTHTYNVILPNLVIKYNMHSISFDGLEADDLVAILLADEESKGFRNTYVLITNDNDYVQLAGKYDFERILIYNLQDKCLLAKNHLQNAEDVQKYLLKKIIMGDKSDNIPSIMKKCGPKTAEKLANDPDELKRLLATDYTVKIRFEQNRKLIDFDFIDNELKEKFLLKLYENT